ncbi:Chitin synthase, class 3, partial [Ascosphaera pollenicola]
MAPIHIEIQGRPKDQIEQWLLTVPEPEGNNYDNLINQDATTTGQHHGYSRSKVSKHQRQRQRSSDDVLEEVHQHQYQHQPPIEEAEAKPYSLPLRQDSEESQSQNVKRKRPPLDIDIMSNCSTTKRDFKKFGRRPRNKTREDKYEPKKKKEKSATATATATATRGQKKSQDGAQKTNASKRLTRRSTTSIESSFKPANIAQGRLTLNNSLGKGFFARSKTSHPVGRLGLPDLSFTDMGFLSKSTKDRHSELPSLAAYDDKSPASTARRSVSKSISRFFSGPQTQKLADTKSHTTTHHQSSESRSEDILHSQRPSITPFRTPSNHHQRGHHAIQTAKANQHPSNCSEAQDDKDERTPLRSDSATVVYSWSPIVASSRQSRQIGQRLSIKASPAQMHRSSEKARSTTRSTPSLNSSLLSKTRKKLFQNVFIGEKDMTRHPDGKVTCTLEQLQELSRQLSEEPCKNHDVADFSDLEKSPREDNGNDHELGVEKRSSSGNGQLEGPGPMNLSGNEPGYREPAEDEDMTGNPLPSLMKED